ncbi:acyltransferase [Eggerthellaceae bacterium 3-80]|nr:acyltransferase [bacterium D16-34]
MSKQQATRATNWDLLRALAMFLVVVTHASGYLGPIHGQGTHGLVSALALICDPIFFALSGYFAIKPMRRSLKNYYLNKVCTIILPLILYSILLYCYTTRLHGMSLGDYFLYFSNILAGGWWFIPALIPCLVAAPFIVKGFEALSDKQVFMLGAVLAVLFCSGALFTYLSWLFSYFQIETLSNLSSLMLNLVPPSLLVRAPAYFEFFLLGGIYRRLAPHITKKMSTRIILIGLACWAIDVYFAFYGIPRQDPSFFWLFIAFAAMALCDRIRINAPAAQKAISWAAQRSYSIYLLQYTTLAFAAAIFYDQSAFGVIADMAAPLRILFWIAMILVAYLLALGIASIVDPFVLKPLQNLFNKAVAKFSQPKDSVPQNSLPKE